MAERDEALREVRQLEYVWIPMRDGATPGRPRLAAGGRRGRPGARHPRGRALPAERRDGHAGRPHPPVLGRARLRLRARGPARQRRVGRLSGGRVPRAGAGGPARGHRLARRPAVVLGRRRHDRHLVGRLQQPPAGRPPAAGAEGDHHAHEHRRPLRRRRALQGRLRARHRPAALEHVHAALAVPAAARGGRRRALARALGAAARGEPAVDPHVARPSAQGRLLAARLGLRGLRRHRDPRVRHRRLDGRLHQQRPAPARGAARAAQGAHRPVAARVPALRHARSGHRLPPGGAALVGPLAQGRRHRRDGRAGAARVDAGVRAAGAVDGRGAGTLGGGGRVAVAAARAPDPAPGRGRRAARRRGRRRRGCRGGRRARRGRRPPQHPRRPALRRRRRRLVRREPAERLRPRPARGGGAVALLHLGAARRGRSRSSATRG